MPPSGVRQARHRHLDRRLMNDDRQRRVVELIWRAAGPESRDATHVFLSTFNTLRL